MCLCNNFKPWKKFSAANLYASTLDSHQAPQNFEPGEVIKNLLNSFGNHASAGEAALESMGTDHINALDSWVAFLSINAFDVTGFSIIHNQIEIDPLFILFTVI